VTGVKLKPGVEVRLQAARVLLAVTQDYQQLDEALGRYNEGLSAQDSALLQAICYGVMRWYIELQCWMQQLAKRSAGDMKPSVQVLILIGLFQLKHMRIPVHAAIHATVECAAHLQSKRAKGLINAVLRAFQRYMSATDTSFQKLVEGQPEFVRYAHPPWMLNRLQTDWPGQWQQVAENNNQQAPMVLRVDTRKADIDEYQSRLASSGIEANKHLFADNALVLSKPVDVEKIPGFSDGLVSVQDAAAQLAAPLLQHDSTHRVLDACAAPGGKTAHILQRTRPAYLAALDNSKPRLERVKDMFSRIGQTAQLIEGDASNPGDWWDNKLFDRILLDAPCSASGVIRRHPDIKYLRTERALQKIIKRQLKILDAMWQLLKPGGMLLYVTCSVFKAENEDQVTALLQRQDDAELAEMSVPWGRGQTGRQILPGDEKMDGFYFALLKKR